jgi:hypothetical protein
MLDYRDPIDTLIFTRNQYQCSIIGTDPIDVIHPTSACGERSEAASPDRMAVHERSPAIHRRVADNGRYPVA